MNTHSRSFVHCIVGWMNGSLFAQIKATVTGSSSIVIRDKKTFGKILQFGGGASVWLPNKASP